MRGPNLQKLGLTNQHSVDLGEMAGVKNRDLKGTFCSGKCYNRFKPSTKGVLVYVGEKFLKKCPRCKSEVLFHDTVTPKRAAKFKEETQ